MRRLSRSLADLDIIQTEQLPIRAMCGVTLELELIAGDGISEGLPGVTLARVRGT